MNTGEKIFISYTCEDWPQVQPYTETLKKNGASLWLDKMAIGPGDGIPDTIEQGMASCTGVILFISQTYLLKPWTIAERRYFTWRSIAEGNLRLVVVRMDESPLPALLAPLAWVKHESVAQVAAFFGGTNSTESLQTNSAQAATKFLTDISDMEVIDLAEALSGRKPGLDIRPGYFPWRTKRTGRVTVHLMTPVSPMALEDLRFKASLHEIHLRFCRSHEKQIAENGLGMFLPAFELQMDKEAVKAKKAISECRDLLESMIDNVSPLA